MRQRNLPLGRIVGTSRRLGLSPKQRAVHMLALGPTGTGKTKFFEHLIRHDIKAGEGLALFDITGNLAQSILEYLSRIAFPPKHVLYIAPGRDDWVCAYNPLARAPKDEWFLINAMKAATLKCWGQDDAKQTPRIDQWLTNCYYTAVTLGLTLPELGMLLQPDPERNTQRQAVLQQLPNERIRNDWQQLCHLAQKKNPVDYDLTVGSTLRRLSAFLDNPRLERIFGVPKVTLDLAAAMDEGAVIIIDLSPKQAQFHPSDAEFFGTLLLTDFYVQMFTRQHPERPFTLYIDEFQNYLTPDIARMLDMARQFGLRLHLAHQRPGQLLNQEDPKTRDIYSAVMNNCRTKVVFGGLSPDELEPVAKALSMGALDPFKEKTRIYTKSVTGYEKQYWEAHGISTSKGHVSSAGSSTGQGTSTGSVSAGAAGTTYDPNTGLFGPSALHTTESASWASQFGTMSFSGDSWGEADIDTESESRMVFPVLVPQMGEQLSAIYYLDLADQFYQFMTIVHDQRQRHAMVRAVDQDGAIPIEVPLVRPMPAGEKDVNRLLLACQKNFPAFLPASQAQALVAQRHKEFLALGHVVHTPVPQENATMEVRTPMDSPSSSIQPVNMRGVQLSDRDFAILKAVFENRFISIKHAAALFWPDATAGEAAAKRRLALLADKAQLLKGQRVNVHGCKLIYRLTKEAVDLLSQHELIPAIMRTDWDGKMRSRYTDAIAPSHLTHELKLYDLKILLQPAIDNHPHLHQIEFGIWPLPYVFEVSYKGRTSAQKPDGFLHVREHPSPSQAPLSHYFYLEFDHRGSEKLDIIVQKTEKYQIYLKHGFGHRIDKPEAPKADRTFRVLFVVDTAESHTRRDNICAKLASASIGTIAYVTTFTDLAAAPLGAVWLTPKDYESWANAGKRGSPPYRALFGKSSTAPQPSGVASTVVE